MTNSFVAPVERQQAPADCCSTLRFTPEKLTHHTNLVCVPAELFISHIDLRHYRFHTWARCTCQSCRDAPLEGSGDDGSRDPRAVQFKKTLLCLAAPTRLPFTVLGLQ